MSLVGCARVSTEDQATDAKVDALTAGGSAVIFREHMSGAKASRPELLKALGKIQRGDMLVMATLDRLVRSLSHLLSVIAELDAKGGHFKSLADPITPRRHRAASVHRCSAPSPNSNACSFGNAPRMVCAPPRDVAASAAIPNCAPAIATPSSA